MRDRLKLAAVAALFVPTPVSAAPLVPGDDVELADKLERFRRVQHGVLSVPLGWGLEAFVSDPTARQDIADFAAADVDTFEEFSGQHIYAALDDYGEFGDLGMFGGVQAAGDAFRYAVLRDTGAPAAEVDAARDQLVAMLDGLHWYTAVTGTPGVVARGLRRAVPQAGAPPLPGTLPATVDLFDGNGDPLPADKVPTWRDDVSGDLPELLWLDDTSKDQFIGYVFALGAAYDAIADDDTIPAELTERLVQDARQIAASLMVEREVGEHTLDLVLVDADGRRTTFFDLAGRGPQRGLHQRLPGQPVQRRDGAGGDAHAVPDHRGRGRRALLLRRAHRGARLPRPRREVAEPVVVRDGD